MKWIHGGYGTLTYKKWCWMKNRCYQPSVRDYFKYGGRGITICERWKSFANFLADMGECPPGYSIERVNVNGNYEPGNCKWIPWKDQYHNTRQSYHLTCFGETRTLAQWARIMKLHRNTIDERIKRGWCLEEALTARSMRSHSRSSIPR